MRMLRTTRHGALTVVCGVLPAYLCGAPDDPALRLPAVTVVAESSANQAPATSFAMPVSALRFEPALDLQARNLPESQSDLTIRGGIFENTGVRVGAVSLLDPQTAHYAAELPISPDMLSAPKILTGPANAIESFNAAVGTVVFSWRPIATGGAAGVGAGSDQLDRENFYEGASVAAGPGRIGLDVDWAHVRSAGPIAFGDSHFNRVNGRLQWRDRRSETDLFAGYQAKFFGWPNLYTPFNSAETENLEMALFVVNHRRDLGGGSYVEAGLFSRRNKDDYAFNRFAPVGAIHPFQHTTRENGAGVHGIQNLDTWGVAYGAEAVADRLESSSLIFGSYHARTLGKLSLVPQKSGTDRDGGHWTAKAGLTYDDSNRTGGSLAPLAALSWEPASSPWREVALSFAQTSQLPDYTALNSSPTSGLFRGNPGLGREVARNFEISSQVTWAGWALQPAIFYRRESALVDWTFRRGVTARSANAVDVATTGFELFARKSWRACEFVVGYTLLSKDADYRGAVVDASFYALNFARDRLTAAVTVHFSSALDLRVDNSARVQQDNPLRTIGGDEALLTQVGVYFHPRALRGLEFSAIVDNLWDSNFQEVPAVPAAPRRWSVGADYRW